MTRRRAWKTCVGLLGFALFSALQAAPSVAQGGKVDLQLVLAVDASGSIDSEEFRLQRAGWAEAISHPKVLGAIRSGGHGAIAVMYLEWAATGCENPAVNWTRISDAVSAQKFANAIMKAERLDCWGGNAIGDAVEFSTKSLIANSFNAKRMVIDVSGDGPNTLGQPIALARERALALGITINGLVIKDPSRFFYAPGGGTLADYYRREITGGPGAFVLVAESRRKFRQAALAKLVREIAAREPAPEDGKRQLATAPARGGKDGE